MKFLELRIPPPLVALVFGLAMWGVSKWQPAVPIDPRLRLGLTALTGLVAISFAIAGFVALHRAHTTVDPIHVDRASAIVTNGVYGVTRNPMYVGLTLLLIAWAIWLAAPCSLAGPLVLALYVHRYQIRPEERAMEAKFGAEYLAYKRRVRRWL